MQTKRPATPSIRTDHVSGAVLSGVRILIASYFLARGTGLVIQPEGHVVFGAILFGEHAAVVNSFYLWVTAFLIMAGRAVRPAALLLAVYVFWTSFVAWDMGIGAEALAGFWRDMALLGAVLLIAITEFAGTNRAVRGTRAVTPRRVASDTPQVAAPRMAQAEADKARAAAINAEPDDEEIENLFGDIWDTPARAA